MANDRRARPIRLSDDAYDGIKLFARGHGSVTVTAFLEALGLALRDVDRPTPFLRSALASAQIIDAERRERGR